MKAIKKSKRVKCHICGKNISIYDTGSLKLDPPTCKECWKARMGDVNPKYVMDEYGEIEVIDFRAITLEKALKLCCHNQEKCGNDVHDVGDCVVFLNCVVKFPNGDIAKYGSFHVIPPKKYSCVFAK